MIDEYQDTNPIQYRLASLLAAKYHNYVLLVMMINPFMVGEERM